MARPIIPKFEPEVLARMARSLGAHLAEIPDTSLPVLEHRGVRLLSRGRRVSELHVMRAGADAVPTGLRAHLLAVFCDSHEGDRYILEFDGFLSETEMRQCVGSFAKAVIGLRHGHNGIDAVSEGVVHIALAAAWEG